MDPNEALKIVRAAVARVRRCAAKEDGGGNPSWSDAAEELADAVEALDSWMGNGGLPPEAWVKPWMSRPASVDEGVFDESGRPNFDGFVKALRHESNWVSQIHSNDKTGQAISDQAALDMLAEAVERVAKRLAYIGSKRSP